MSLANDMYAMTQPLLFCLGARAQKVTGMVKCSFLIISLFVLQLIAFPLTLTSLVYAGEGYVYYGYIPPSTDIAQNLTIAGERESYTNLSRNGWVEEQTRSGRVSYVVPSGYSLLDIVGWSDNTHVEVWDLLTGEEINSTTVNRLEKQTVYIRHGTFFKVVASQKLAVMLSGGADCYAGESTTGGFSTFYPSVEGGFRGKEFMFMAAAPTHPYAYTAAAQGFNFFLMAPEEVHWKLQDSNGIWSTEDTTKQRGIRTIMLQSRVWYTGEQNGVGSSVVFDVTASDDVIVSCAASDDYEAVPALTGGFVGKDFYAPVHQTLQEPGRTCAFIVMPLEEGKVTVYSKALDVLAEKTFTSEDVANRAYWFKDIGNGKFELFAESTGNICFMVGQTMRLTTEDFLGDDITFMGSKPGEEIRFYAPTMAVVFAPETTSVTIDGKAPSTLEESRFLLLDSGPHSVKADGHVIVEILAQSTVWDSWGNYLILPSDVDKTYTVPSGLLEKPVDYNTYIIIAAVVVAAAAAAILILRRRQRKQV